MRKLDLTKQAQKFLKKLPAKQGRQLVQKINALRDEPLPQDSKMMRGSQADYRADQGEYRIIYRFNDETLYILIVDRRNDGAVYKKYARLVKMILLRLV